MADWFETATGRRCDLTADEPDYTFTDIMYGLARTCRFGGQLRTDVEYYSVAEHCVHLATYVLEHDILESQRDLRTILMHDAFEGLTGLDAVRPVKALLPDLVALEDRTLHKMARRFQFDYPFPAWLKDLDARILVDERRQVMNYAHGNRWQIDHLEPLNIKVNAWSPFKAREEFFFLAVQCDLELRGL